MLTNSEGLPVIGEGGTPIILQEGMEDVRIGDNGSLLVTRGGAQAVEAQLDVVEAVRPRMLEAVGGNRFRIPDEVEAEGIMAEIAPQDQMMKSGALETSNVNMGTQITEMLMAQRAYQFNAKTISTSDQMMGLVNQLRS
jgi:flagellar basal-body rod protein FlgG